MTLLKLDVLGVLSWMEFLINALENFYFINVCCEQLFLLLCIKNGF